MSPIQLLYKNGIEIRVQGMVSQGNNEASGDMTPGPLDAFPGGYKLDSEDPSRLQVVRKKLDSEAKMTWEMWEEEWQKQEFPW